MISFDFRDMLFGPWETARAALVNQLDLWVANLNTAGAASAAATAGTATFVTGDLKMAGTTTTQDGWLLCDGTLYSRVTKKRLFDVIGITHGAGDGSTNFAVPDLRQRFPLGLAAGGTGSVLGGTGGSIDHAHSVPGLSIPGLSVPGLSVPGLGVSATTSSDGSHTHTGTTGTGNTAADLTDPASPGSRPSKIDHVHTFTTDAAGTHSHTLSTTTGGGTTGTGTTGTGTSGTGTSGTTNPPFLAVPFFIKD